MRLFIFNILGAFLLLALVACRDPVEPNLEPVKVSASTGRAVSLNTVSDLSNGLKNSRVVGKSPAGQELEQALEECKLLPEAEQQKCETTAEAVYEVAKADEEISSQLSYTQLDFNRN